jgi:hypothetical protein
MGAGWLDHLRSPPRVTPQVVGPTVEFLVGAACQMTQAWSPETPNEHTFLDHDQMPLNQGPEISRTMIK